MFRISLIFALAGAAIAQTGFPVSERQIMAGSAHVKSGTITFKSVLTPAGTSSSGLGAGGIWTDSNTVHRYMIDKNNKLYFGYDLVIGPRDASGACLATFQPLSHTDRIDAGEISGMTLMLLSKYPAPQLVHDGETIALDLMVSADGRQRLTDYIGILSQAPPAAKTTAEPRDFTVDDGPVSFDISQWTFWKQGQVYENPGFTGNPGSTLWMALPGEGRYILSLTPHEGFTKSGTVRDNVVAFSDAGQHYEMRFQSPVAGAGKAWNLYVKHDLTYKASHAQVGSDRLENLLAKSN